MIITNDNRPTWINGDTPVDAQDLTNIVDTTIDSQKRAATAETAAINSEDSALRAKNSATIAEDNSTVAVETAEYAKETAIQSKTISNTAIENSNTAIENSNNAIETANSAIELSKQANLTAIESKTISTTAAKDADLAKQGALAAAQDANAAQVAASNVANDAKNIANTANNKSNTAIETANSAVNVANQSLALSQTANDNSLAAKDIASIANTNSEDAKTKANEAVSTANSTFGAVAEANQQVIASATSAEQSANSAAQAVIEAQRAADAAEAVAESGGTQVSVNDIVQTRINFTRDPQTQIDNIISGTPIIEVSSLSELSTVNDEGIYFVKQLAVPASFFNQENQFGILTISKVTVVDSGNLDFINRILKIETFESGLYASTPRRRITRVYQILNDGTVDEIPNTGFPIAVGNLVTPYPAQQTSTSITSGNQYNEGFRFSYIFTGVNVNYSKITAGRPIYVYSTALLSIFGKIVTLSGFVRVTTALVLDGYYRANDSARSEKLRVEISISGSTATFSILSAGDLGLISLNNFSLYQ